MHAVIRIRMSTPHYAGNLVDGAAMLALFGDVATELCVRADGDEGLFRAYDSVEFLAPVYAGDFIEARGEIVAWGNTSLKMRFTAHKYVTPLRGDGFKESAAELLGEPILVCRATGTCVVPKDCRRTPLVRGTRAGFVVEPAAAPSVEPIGRPGPCIVTAAIVGAETTREQNPHLPITADELGEEAARCAAQGATVIHLHVRDEAGRASQDTERFRAAIAAIRSRCDVIIQTSTGGAVGMSIDERCGPLKLTGRDAPDMATLNVGTINFGDDIFVNKRQDTMEVARRIRAAGAVPEVEIYDLGHLDITRELVDKGLLSLPLHVQFVLGVRGALSASPRNVELLVERLASDFRGSSWGVAGIGRHQLPMAQLAAQLGGNVRVGLEDNIYLDKGVLAAGSAPLVERAVKAVHEAGRRVATVAEARQILLGQRTV
jgi:3-keto-5-aminohexanoate cleavage enzyme